MFVCTLYFVSSFLTTARFELLTGWMSWSVHLKDRKAAYHVRNRQATDICHLQSFISLLPASVPPTHTYTHLHKHTLLLAQCPHFQSISATYLPHHSNCSLRHSSFLYCAGEWKEWDGEGGCRGWVVHLGRLVCSERCCFSSKKLSPDTCPIDTLKWLPTQQKWWDDSPCLQIGRWECDAQDSESSGRACCCLRTGDITCSHYPGCFIEFHPLVPHHLQRRPHCHHGRHYHHNLHKCHSSSSSSLFVRLLKGFKAPAL